ncbi:MAG TPA: hypothetical protein VKB05_12460 [Pyrinomonadaceae bacterium]|nr:hypothetical protein [Pyrinomonadaceae bacterium]
MSTIKNKPSEDFARATLNYVDEDNKPLIVEVTTSWSYVGAGLRLTLEVLDPGVFTEHELTRQRFEVVHES